MQDTVNWHKANEVVRRIQQKQPVQFDQSSDEKHQERCEIALDVHHNFREGWGGLG